MTMVMYMAQAVRHGIVIRIRKSRFSFLVLLPGEKTAHQYHIAISGSIAYMCPHNNTQEFHNGTRNSKVVQRQ